MVHAKQQYTVTVSYCTVWWLLHLLMFYLLYNANIAAEEQST